MTKLCVCTPNVFSYSETFIQNQVKHLSPAVVINNGWYPVQNISGRAFLEFPYNNKYLRAGIRKFFPAYFHKAYNRQLATFLKEEKFTTLLAEYGVVGAHVMDACKEAGLPFVVHFHGFDAFDYQTLQKWGAMYKRMFVEAKAIIAVSRDMEQQLIKLGASPDKVKYNPYGVDVNKFQGAQPGATDPVFIAVGRFVLKKAPQLTIKAFKIVLQSVPNARLVMIGDGALFEECKALAVELGIASSVDFKGVLKPEQISEELKKARAFVQHSVVASNGDSEGLPNTILEAASTGLPIVSTYHAGIPDAILHEKSGFLVKEKDVEGMAKYMIQLAQNPALAKEMGQAARQYMLDHFAIHNRIQKLKEILGT
ncbi:MAG: glycosyltransferase [Flavobacteriales bacterium]